MRLKDVLRRCMEAGSRLDPRPSRASGAGKAPRGGPCPETRLLHGEPGAEVRGAVLVGIDVGIGEILVADRLRERGESVSLVVAHRTDCGGGAAPKAMFSLRAGLLSRFGVPVAVTPRRPAAGPAEPVTPALERDVDAARLLDIPYLCVRMPADLLSGSYLQERLDALRPPTLGDAVEALRGIDEYRHACQRRRGPRLARGKGGDAAGRVYVDMDPDGEDSARGYAAAREAGAGSVVALHATPAHLAGAVAAGLPLIDAGQVASDSLGLNLLLDEVFAGQPLRVVPCSGFRRVERPTVRASAA